MSFDDIYEQAVADFCRALDQCDGKIVLPNEQLTGEQWLNRFKLVIKA